MQPKDERYQKEAVFIKVSIALKRHHDQGSAYKGKY